MVREHEHKLSIAFAELQRELHAYLQKRLNNRSLAEDLCQEVFMKALMANRSSPNEIHNIRAWLYTLARNVLADYYRSAQQNMDSRAEDLDEGLLASTNEDENEIEAHHRLSHCLRPFIEELSPMYREAIISADFDGVKLADMAVAQNKSLSAIKSRVVRARALLKDKVLACCHVELQDGLVTDYHQRHRSQKC